MAWAAPRAATAARMTASGLVGRRPGHGGARRRWTCTVAPSMVRVPVCTAFSMPGAASARLDRCATWSSPGRPTGRRRGRRCAASCAVTPVVGAPQLGPSVSVKVETRPAHRVVQGARRAGRRVGHARAGPRPRRGGLVGRQPRPGPGLRRLQARRHRHRRRAHGRLGGQGVGPAAVRRAPRPARRGLPRGRDPRPRAGRRATGSRYVSPYNDPDVIAGQATLARELVEQVPGPRAPSSCPAAAAGCWPASSSAWRGRACASSGSSPRRRPP